VEPNLLRGWDIGIFRNCSVGSASAAGTACGFEGSGEWVGPAGVSDLVPQRCFSGDVVSVARQAILATLVLHVELHLDSGSFDFADEV
jgi:hypothetical protein